jgi:DNA-binding response OmpR family regulator
MANSVPLVLVVDDNEMNRDMLSRRLKRQEYEVLVAEDGERALEMLREHPFDLVLLDIMMPKLSGYEVLERIKKDDATRHLPVIMISAVDDLDSVVKCIELGAEDYLFKPFNPVLLKARVSASLEKRLLQQSALSPAELAPYLQAMQAEIAVLSAAISGDGQPALERLQQTVSSLMQRIRS